MAESLKTRNLEVLGDLNIVIHEASRADTPALGTVHAYRENSSIVVEIYDALNGTPAWRVVGEQVSDVQLTAAQVKALAATNITLVAAPAAGLAVVPTRVHLYNDFLTAAFAQPAGSDALAIRYTASTEITELGSEAQMTTFIEAGADAALHVPITSVFVPVAATALVLDNNGASEYTTGDGTFSVRTYYLTVSMAAFS